MALPARKVIVIGAASVALAAAGVLPSYAFAAQNTGTTRPAYSASRKFGFKVVGTVQSIDGSTIVLLSPDGTTHYIDALGARIVKAGAPATTSVIAVGDPIAVVGPNSADGQTTETIIDESAQQPTTQVSNGIVIGGALTPVSPNTFLLTPKTNPGRPARPAVTVEINGDTIIMKNGQTVNLSALTPGTEAIVSGLRESGGAVAATKVIVRKA